MQVRPYGCLRKAHDGTLELSVANITNYAKKRSARKKISYLTDKAKLLMTEGKLVPDRDWEGNLLSGKMVCVSCYKWNCWHARGEACDIRNCGCKLGYIEPFTASPPPRALNGILCGIYARVTLTDVSARLLSKSSTGNVSTAGMAITGTFRKRNPSTKPPRTINGG